MRPANARACISIRGVSWPGLQKQAGIKREAPAAGRKAAAGAFMRQARSTVHIVCLHIFGNLFAVLLLLLLNIHQHAAGLCV